MGTGRMKREGHGPIRSVPMPQFADFVLPMAAQRTHGHRWYGPTALESGQDDRRTTRSLTATAPTWALTVWTETDR